MKNIVDYIFENEVDEIFKKQDEFKQKMIDAWKTNDDLKVFDKYFQWKTHKLDISDITIKDVNDMRLHAQKMLEKLWDEGNNEELEQIIDAIEMELLNMILSGNLKKS